MRVVIIEDEAPAAARLARLLQNTGDDVEVLKQLDSVEAATRYLQNGGEADLLFMDIQLGDGLSFDIFQQTEVKCPVIFTTAFDQYTLKAFKVNSVDYLLKPIDENELQAAVEKYRQLYHTEKNGLPQNLQQLIETLQAPKYKERLLIKRGQQLSYLKTEQVAYCFADGKLCYAVDFTGNKLMLEVNLTILEEQLHPAKFYRINRSLLVNIDAVHKVHTWLGSRLKLELQPSTKADTVVSRERVNGFKEWLGQ
ncbi:MAG: response regulator transcription factor [Chitinophagaceae bacterium]|nr:response regulator transcription factor [Chitinophagaceae bacterium]